MKEQGHKQPLFNNLEFEMVCTSGQAEKITGLKFTQLLYIEKLGLVVPKRSGGKSRQDRSYTRKNIEELLFIRKQKENGLRYSQIEAELDRWRKERTKQEEADRILKEVLFQKDLIRVFPVIFDGWALDQEGSFKGLNFCELTQGQLLELAEKRRIINAVQGLSDTLKEILGQSEIETSPEQL